MIAVVIFKRNMKKEKAWMKISEVLGVDGGFKILINIELFILFLHATYMLSSNHNAPIILRSLGTSSVVRIRKWCVSGALPVGRDVLLSLPRKHFYLVMWVAENRGKATANVFPSWRCVSPQHGAPHLPTALTLECINLVKLEDDHLKTWSAAPGC